MSTFDDLKKAKKEANSILSCIINIVHALEDDELSLVDLDAKEESLENRCYELQEKLKEVVQLRQLFELEELGKDLF